jgi:hypothetical protein
MSWKGRPLEGYVYNGEELCDWSLRQINPCLANHIILSKIALLKDDPGHRSRAVGPLGACKHELHCYLLLTI